MTILIANATSPRNHGDQAILGVLIGFVKDVYPQASLVVHSADPSLYVDKRSYTVKHTLYSWSVFHDKKTLTRVVRISTLLLQYLLLRSGIEGISLDGELSDLLSDYRQADLILFAGGGYLRSRKGLKQFLNLTMQVSLFKYATLYPAKKLVGPISIGPFGYGFQERLVMSELKKMDRITIRENVSQSIVKKYKLKNSIRSSDHALMLRNTNNSKSDRRPSGVVIGFTLRQWMQGKKQRDFEASVAFALEQFVLLTGAKIQPIIQVDASEYGEDDGVLTKAIIRILHKKKIETLPVKRIRSVKDGLLVYSDLDLLLGMRMHSNIFAASQGVPFVAISYEHKTVGIAKDLLMQKYCISCEELNGKRLYDLMVDAFMKRKRISKKLIRTIENIQKIQTVQWNKYLVIN